MSWQFDPCSQYRVEKSKSHERKNKEISLVHEQQNKLHKCDICGKSYLVYSRLKRHISVVHEG